MKPEKIERRPSSEERLEVLRDLFPEVFTDGRVALDRLKELLEDVASDGPVDEHYALNWPGKQQARRLANQPPHVTLRPVPKAGVDEETTGNMVIVGDNLQVLLALQKSYASLIKLIYIDPPYNTGNDFVYKDTFAIDEELYLQETRQADLHGRLVSNPQTSGRFHSNWLSFMYPRLAVAQRLLREDGFIVVSIDDGEVANLRLLMNQIFGEENFVAEFVWKARHFPDERAVTHISVDHEYFLVYSRTTGTAFRGVERDETKFSNPDNDPRGPWMSRSMLGLATREQRPNLHYPIKDPKTGNKFEPPEATGWRYAPEKMTRLIAEGCVLFPKKADGRPREKKFRSDLTSELRAIPSIVTDVHTSDGTKEIREIFGFQAFDFPKPADLIRRFVEQTTEDGDLVLDFFAGSGTTGHGVWLQNQAQSSNRRFILVQLDAPIDEKSASAKAILDAGLDTIDKITCERLRRVSKAMKAEGVKGDIGFRVFKEDSPALARPLHLAAEQLEKGQLAMFKEKLAHVQPADLFTEVLLLLGFPLDTKREPVPTEGASNTLWRFEHPRVPQPLLLCLDQKIDDDLLDALKGKKNHIFVCRDEALTDVSKARFYDALKLADSTFKVL